MTSEEQVISVEYLGRVAVITISNPKKLNALTQAGYYDLATKMNEVATHEEVFVTVLLGKGRYFSAGADVSVARPAPEDPKERHHQLLQTFVANNLNLCNAFANHPKILVVGLNGPAVGLSAAVSAFADFIYCVPSAFLLTPFSSLGLVAEGGASRALVSRLGVSKANEALIMSKRIPAEELKAVGYVNEIFDVGEPPKGQSQSLEQWNNRFRERVLKEVDDRLGSHLIGESLTGIKKLIRGPEQDAVKRANVDEVFAGLERFMKGVPQEEFRKITSGQKRHKL